MDVYNGFVIGRFGMGGTRIVRKATIIDKIYKKLGMYDFI